MAYADYDDTYVLSTAEVETLLSLAGNRGQQFFDAMAVAGGQTTSTAGLTYAQMAQTYILTAGADVDSVLEVCGPRGTKLMDTALTLKAI